MTTEAPTSTASTLTTCSAKFEPAAARRGPMPKRCPRRAPCSRAGATRSSTIPPPTTSAPTTGKRAQPTTFPSARSTPARWCRTSPQEHSRRSRSSCQTSVTTRMTAASPTATGGSQPGSACSSPTRRTATGSTALFVVWDEPTPMPFLAIAPAVHQGAIVSEPVDHYSLLRTTEELLGIDTYLGAANQRVELPIDARAVSRGQRSDAGARSCRTSQAVRDVDRFLQLRPLAGADVVVRRALDRVPLLVAVRDRVVELRRRGSGSRRGRRRCRSRAPAPRSRPRPQAIAERVVVAPLRQP